MKNYREMPLDKLALHLASRGVKDAAHILQQVEGWQRLRTKVPAWAALDDLSYPPRISLEQCSGEEAARYKAAVVEGLFPQGGRSFADLTGGLGVDFSFMARTFVRAVYVERMEHLCDLARHNFPLLGLTRAQVVCADAATYLHTLPEGMDLLFLDPARRSATGRKTVLINDCEPDVCTLKDELLRKARYVLVKLSPMLDIADAVRSLGCVSQVHLVGVGGECKELLLLLERPAPDSAGQAPRPDGPASASGKIAFEPNNPMVFVREGTQVFSFRPSEEAQAQVPYASVPATYLYEPGPAVMKAGAFKLVAARYGLSKCHPNSHLYTSDTRVEGFPGRCFKVLGYGGMSKKELARLRSECPKANLTVRNFPASVDALKRKLKLKDGGSRYLFATTMHDNQHLLITCEKIS